MIIVHNLEMLLHPPQACLLALPNFRGSSVDKASPSLSAYPLDRLVASCIIRDQPVWLAFVLCPVSLRNL